MQKALDGSPMSLARARALLRRTAPEYPAPPRLRRCGELRSAEPSRAARVERSEGKKPKTHAVGLGLPGSQRDNREARRNGL